MWTKERRLNSTVEDVRSYGWKIQVMRSLCKYITSLCDLLPHILFTITIFLTLIDRAMAKDIPSRSFRLFLNLKKSLC